MTDGILNLMVQDGLWDKGGLIAMDHLDLNEVQSLVGGIVLPSVALKAKRKLEYMTRYNIGERVWTGNLGWGEITAEDMHGWDVKLDDSPYDYSGGKDINYTKVYR